MPVIWGARKWGAKGIWYDLAAAAAGGVVFISVRPAGMVGRGWCFGFSLVGGWWWVRLIASWKVAR
jgi:hypothetical protein